jgi:hypothetical protein
MAYESLLRPEADGSQSIGICRSGPRKDILPLPTTTLSLSLQATHDAERKRADSYPIGKQDVHTR